MPDLGIAHLSRGQADLVPRGIEECHRAFGEEPVPHRHAGLADRVVRAIAAVAPAVKHAEDDRAGALCLAHGVYIGQGSAGE